MLLDIYRENGNGIKMLGNSLLKREKEERERKAKRRSDNIYLIIVTFI